MAAYFPQSIPGIDIQVSRVPCYSTKVLRTSGGGEVRVSRWSAPRFRFRVKFNVLWDGNATGRTNTAWSLLSLYHDSGGSAGEFWFLDPFDSSYRKCRFDADELELERIALGRWRTAEVNLLTTGESYGGGATGLGDLLGDALGA